MINKTINKFKASRLKLMFNLFFVLIFLPQAGCAFSQIAVAINHKDTTLRVELEPKHNIKLR